LFINYVANEGQLICLGATPELKDLLTQKIKKLKLRKKNYKRLLKGTGLNKVTNFVK
jgi:hypothetical protein